MSTGPLGPSAAKARRILQDGGPRALAQRAVRYWYRRLGAAALDEPLLDEDIADSTDLRLAVPTSRPPRERPLRIGWVMVPPNGGSGGHTTLFRMVEAVERAGHECVVFLYDRYGGDAAEQARTIRRWWPEVRAEIRDARDGIQGVDACVASSWESAHVLARRGGAAPMRRLYFIQDYEPYFYAHGPRYALAEDSYRFGYRCIALGGMVAGLLRSEIGVEPDVTAFGCDTTVYRLLPEQPRSGVVFFARPETPRRGYWLGRVALRRFHELHPDVPIHLYGARVEDLDFPAIQHGTLTPEELNALYNRTIAGLCLSFTNISLVPEEMLAAGVVPVLNDAAFSREVLPNDVARWAPPTPRALANALSEVVTSGDLVGQARRAAASARDIGWATAQADVVRIVEDEVYGADVLSGGASGSA